MVKYGLADKYSRYDEVNYTFSSLLTYLMQTEPFLDLTEDEESEDDVCARTNHDVQADIDANMDADMLADLRWNRFVRNIHYANTWCRRFLSEHGFSIENFFENEVGKDFYARWSAKFASPLFQQNDFQECENKFTHPILSSEEADPEHKSPASYKSSDRGSDKARVFSYLKLLAYVIEKVSSQSMTYNEFFGAIQKPSYEYINLYESILSDWAETQMGKSLPIQGVLSYEKSIQVHIDSLLQIGRMLPLGYGEADVEKYSEKINFFATKAEGESVTGLVDENIPECETYLSAFYKSVCFARACVCHNEFLRSFLEVKECCTPDRKAEGNYDKMLRLKHRKIGCDDQMLLYYETGKAGNLGKIIEVANESDMLWQDLPPDDIYLAALYEYINEPKKLRELAGKVFCTDTPGKNEKQTLSRYVKRFCEYWKMELEQMGKHAPLTKVKLISIFQVICLSLPRAKFGPRKLGLVKNQKGYRENCSLSSTFLESSDKNPYYQQLICVWVEYQTLLNSATPKQAQRYLDYQITALTNILNIGRATDLAQIQERAERIVRWAVRVLIPESNEIAGLRSFLLELSKLSNEKISLTESFVKNAILNRFGSFCWLFNERRTANLVWEQIKDWDGVGTKKVDITMGMGNTLKSNLQPLCIQILRNKTEKNIELASFEGDVQVFGENIFFKGEQKKCEK